MKTILVLLTAVMLVAATAPAQADNGRIRVRTGHGVVAGGAYNGNAYVRARGAHANADGSVTTAGGGAFRLNNGAYGARGSTTTWNPDGSVSHSGQAAVSGARGSAATSGSFSRTSGGSYSGSRTTEVTSRATGDTYTGATAYSNGAYSHTGTCTDASGAVIACPR